VSTILGEFRIGEDIVVAFAPQQLPAASITILGVAMSPAASSGGDYVVLDNTIAITLTVASLAAQGATPAGWTFTLAAASSAGLAPGVYAIDAKFQVGGSVEKTALSALVRLTRAAVV
jgi:hypothetical protein